MLIGLDLDNTIVCYDAVFARLAAELGLPANVVSAGKKGIRDYLRGKDREEEWTLMQGQAYGSRMSEAKPFEGVLEFVAAAAGAGEEICVVSHRTKVPFLGKPVDLHASALEWLAAQKVDSRARVFLEETAAAKAARIQTLGCDVFIDDLPEFLGRADFPTGTRKLLFVPDTSVQGDGLEVLRGWAQAANLLLKK